MKFYERTSNLNPDDLLQDKPYKFWENEKKFAFVIKRSTIVELCVTGCTKFILLTHVNDEWQLATKEVYDQWVKENTQ